MKEMQVQTLQMLVMEACETCKLCVKNYIHEQVVTTDIIHNMAFLLNNNLLQTTQLGPSLEHHNNVSP
jgi:hypothetical protein